MSYYTFMALPLAGLVARLLLMYLATGAVFAVAFVLRGAQRLDPVAAGGTVGFRLLILPGAMFLWPYLAYRWLRGPGHPPEERTAHRAAARRNGR